MIYGYLRVSSDDQDVNSQKQGVVKFAQSKNWIIDEFITDEGVSGGKDPDKRNLGPLLQKIQKGDIIISSEISRLGRDLYMVMDILHFAMERECVIYTVKDNFVLGNDIQSKVLAFAFGLSAEIERQMIRQRTREGLMRRVRMGVLLGRPIGKNVEFPQSDIMKDKKEMFIQQYKWGVPERRIAENFGVSRNTVIAWLHKWGLKKSKYYVNMMKRQSEKKRNLNGVKQLLDREDFLVIEDIDRNKLKTLIEQDLTIPQINDCFPNYSYDEIYDTILCDVEFNKLYRKHGQKKAVKGKK